MNCISSLPKSHIEKRMHESINRSKHRAYRVSTSHSLGGGVLLFSTLAKPRVRIINEKLNLCILCAPRNCTRVLYCCNDLRHYDNLYFGSFIFLLVQTKHVAKVLVNYTLTRNLGESKACNSIPNMAVWQTSNVSCIYDLFAKRHTTTSYQ